MAILSFAKNKFPKFLSLSNTATPTAPSIFHTKYGPKEATTQKISNKNSKSNYENYLSKV